MSSTLPRLIKSNSFLLVAHYATFAYQDLLYDYLTERRAKLVTKLNFPLPELPLLKHVEIFTSYEGKKNKPAIISSFVTPPLFAYFFQALQYLWLILISEKKYDYIIAEDSLLACCSIILRFLGKSRKVIFYSHGIDFTRFSHSFANWLYQRLDRFSATHSDFDWFLSQNMIPIRKQQGVSPKRMFWIPSSLPIKSLPRKKSVHNYKLVFLGVLNDKNGVGILPEVIEELRKEIPDVTLDVMGEGDMKEALAEEIRRLKLTRHIHLLGNLQFHKFKNLLTYYRAGIVTYKYSTNNLIPTSDSMKLRVYLTAGLPVVITKGFVFSDEVTKHHLGFSVEYDVKDFATKLLKILTDEALSDKFRANALDYSKKMDITNIYNSTFSTILINNT